jgi:acetyl esterase/lipase
VAAPNDEQQRVLSELSSLGGKPIETLSASEARKQPSPADAVTALLKLAGKSTMPAAVAHVVNRTIPTPAGALPVRIYSPAGAGPFPVMVYYHGGGFVIATMDTYDASARALVAATNAVLVSVEYRKAPEYKFPAAHDDAYAAYAWVVANATTLRGDTARLALVGESAGGNLAVATAVMARDKGIRAPVAIVAVYPIVGSDTNTTSYQTNAMAKPLSRPMMSWFFAQYSSTPADAANPRLNLLNADVRGLPPTTIINAQIDPLLSDGEMLAAKLRDAGVTVQYKRFDGVAHEFFGQGAVLSAARDAVQFAADGLNKVFH